MRGHPTNAAKCFYDDAVDRAGSDAAARKAHLARIRSLDGFHVREGTVAGAKPRRQKQVDIQLAVDALNHAFRGNYWRAILVAGDLDFKPLVESLVLLGRHVHVYYERTSVAQGLRDAADVAAEMTLRDFWLWSSSAFKNTHTRSFPTELHNEPVPPAKPRGKGTWKGHPLELFFDEHASVYHLWISPSADARSWSVRHADLAVLEKYVKMMGEPLCWEVRPQL